MKKMRCFCLFLFAVLLPPASAGAFDFSLITNQYAGYYNQTGGENIFEYRGNLAPRIYDLIGDTGEYIITANLSFGAKDEFFFVPELLRTEINFRFGGRLGERLGERHSSSVIRAGRINYTDPLGFIAGGLFDGVQFSHNSSAGIFRVGAWYTGFLYKETAKITMTDNDRNNYEAELDYGDIVNTYFAPARLLTSLDWEHSSIAGLFSFKAALTGQFDFTDADEKLHSQYLTVKASIPIKRFLLEIGGSLELMQTAADSNFTMAYAGDFGVYWTLPLSFHSRLSFTGHIAGGRADDFIAAFVPVTTKTYGGVFQPKLSALSILTLNYTARLNPAIGVGLSASCLVRNDLETYTDYPVSEDGEGRILGTEILANIVWSPASDLQFNIGGGAFLPALGDAGPKEQTLWRAEITVTFSIY